MPVALLAALLGSLAIHAAALVGMDVELFGGGPEPEPAPLRAEIRPLPEAPPAPPKVAPTTPPAPAAKATRPPRPASPRPLAQTAPVAALSTPEPEPEIVPEMPSTASMTPALPAKPILPASGTIRFAIFKESLGFQVGRAEHRWEFGEDGRYRLTGITETSGLVSLFKPIRIETESSGRMVAGAAAETYRTLKNGKDAGENADFDWSTAGSPACPRWQRAADCQGHPGHPVAQLPVRLSRGLAEGSVIGVVTGRKYERYAVDSLGEEDIETPAGRFRTLHLRAMTDKTTEVWIALDRQRLPVRIRFTDKKGESFEQVATEIGSP